MLFSNRSVHLVYLLTLVLVLYTHATKGLVDKRNCSDKAMKDCDTFCKYNGSMCNRNSDGDSCFTDISSNEGFCETLQQDACDVFWSNNGENGKNSVIKKCLCFDREVNTCWFL